MRAGAIGLFSLSMLGNTSAWAACSVDGGGPIVDGSVVTCTGTTTTAVSAPSALGVSVTIAPGATITVTGTAIDLGDGAFVDAQLGSAINGSGSNGVVRIGKNGVASLRGTVTNANGNTAVFVDTDSVAAVYGTLQGRFAGADYFIYGSATTGAGSLPRYVSNAGHIQGAVSLALPISSKSEFYNEPGGVLDSSIDYATAVGLPLTVYGTFDVVISNRGHIGKEPSLGESVQMRIAGYPANLDFRNEAGGVIDGNVHVMPGFRADGARGTNAGEIKGDVYLDCLPIVATGSPSPGGTSQRFTNNAAVRGVVLRSGDFIQNPSASFAPTSTLRVEGGSMQPAPVRGYYMSKLQINGVHAAGCLSSASDSGTVGGVVELGAGAQLGINVATGQTCSFSGVFLGAGGFIKNGAGTQVLGADIIPPHTWVRPSTDYSGVTAINAGTLVATRSDALGVGTVQIAHNATLQLAANATSPPNSIQLLGLSTIDVAAPNSSIGSTSGLGRLIKQGSGVLRAPVALSQADGSEVRAGGLRIDAVHTGIATVFNGATLGGGGTINGTLIANAGGIIAPAFDATSPVMLHSGGLSLSSGAHLQLSAIPSGNDAVAVNGSVSLGGATLELQLSGTIPPGTTLLLIDNDGADAVQGSFAGLPQNTLFVANGMLLQISYSGGSGNDVTVGVINSDRIFYSGLEP